jgi:hypothetical protein
MIELNEINEKAIIRIAHDEFFFASKSRNNIRVEGLSILLNEKDNDQFVCVLPNDTIINDEKVPFYLQHTDLFINAQRIFEELFNVEADVLLMYAYKKDCTKSSFLFSNRAFIERALNRESINFLVHPNNMDVLRSIDKDISLERKQGRDIHNIEMNHNGINFTLPNGVFPVVGTYNGIEVDEKHPNFNLIFGSYSLKEFSDLNKTISADSPLESNAELAGEELIEEEKWIYDVDELVQLKFRQGLPLYCIKRFDLKTKNSTQYYDPKNMVEFYNESNKECTGIFVEAISDLLLAYNRGNYLGVDVNSFFCCMPHFYNVDRTEQTAAKKPQSIRKLNGLYRVARQFGEGRESLSFKHFIEFFILESVIDLEQFKANPGDEIYKALTEKKTIKQLIGPKQILTDFLEGKDKNEAFEKFVKNQVEARERILSILDDYYPYV